MTNNFSNIGQGKFDREFFRDRFFVLVFFYQTIGLFEHPLRLFEFLFENLVIKVH